MLKKVFAGVVICAFVAAPAQAAKIWTIEMHGILASGSARWFDLNPDSSIDLSGKEFTQTITASIDPDDWSASSAPAADYTYFRSEGSGPSFSTKITVNGRTDTYTAVSTEHGMQKVETLNLSSTRLNTQQSGMTAQGDNLLIMASVTALPADWLKPLSAGQANVSYNSLGFFDGIVYFSKYSDSNERVSFSGNLDRVTVSISAIPEPSSYATLLGGLGLISALVRRRRAGSGLRA